MKFIYVFDPSSNTSHVYGPYAPSHQFDVLLRGEIARHPSWTVVGMEATALSTIWPTPNNPTFALHETQFGYGKEPEVLHVSTDPAALDAFGRGMGEDIEFTVVPLEKL